MLQLSSPRGFALETQHKNYWVHLFAHVVSVFASVCLLYSYVHKSENGSLAAAAAAVLRRMLALLCQHLIQKQ